MRLSPQFGFALGLLFANLLPGKSCRWRIRDGRAPIVIWHCGAAGYLPEQTIEGHRRAIELGADLVGLHLVSTTDGRLIARHEPLLDGM